MLTEGARPVISAGNNLYLNAGDLINRLGDLSAGKDAVLTGRNFISENRYEGTLGKYLIYQQDPYIETLKPEPMEGGAFPGGLFHTRQIY